MASRTHSRSELTRVGGQGLRHPHGQREGHVRMRLRGRTRAQRAEARLLLLNDFREVGELSRVEQVILVPAVRGGKELL